MKCVDVALDLLEIVNARLGRHAWGGGGGGTLAGASVVTATAIATAIVVAVVVVVAVVDVVPVHRTESNNKMIREVGRS